MTYSPKVYSFFSKNIDSYTNYISLTNQKTVAADYISLKIKNETKNKYFRILCIGAGTGDPEIKIIKEISDYNFTIDYLDPSKEMKELFLENLKGAGIFDKLKNTFTLKYEEFPFKKNEYDIILSINSIQFIENWKNNLEINPILKMYESLKPDGKLLFVIKSEESPHEKIKKTSGGGKTTGSILRQALKQLNLIHFWENVPAQIDFSDCYSNGNFSLNEKGHKLISFIFRGEWDVFSLKMKNKIIKILGANIVYQDEKYILPSLYEYIWVTKIDNKKKANQISKKSLESEKEKLRLILEKNIRTIPNFPVKGILFRDTTNILRNKNIMKQVMSYVKKLYFDKKIKYVVAKDMQGLIWAGAISTTLGTGVIPMFRKDLAGEVISTTYSHEYNDNRNLLLQKEAINIGDKVLIVDYIIATGSTIINMDVMLKHLGADVVGVFTLIELDYLKGNKKFEHLQVESIVHY